MCKCVCVVQDTGIHSIADTNSVGRGEGDGDGVSNILELKHAETLAWYAS